MTEAARLVDELTTLLYEVLKRWEVHGRVCEIVQCGACRRKADKPSSVVHESDCPVRRLWQALELGEVVVRANAEEICDLEDERDCALGKLAELTRTAEWVTARCESANARIAALLAERDALASRLAAAEARIAEIRDGSQAYRYWRTNNDVLMYSCRFCPSPIEAVGRDGDHQHHRICVLNPDYEAGMQAIRNERAALAGSREQATP